MHRKYLTLFFFTVVAMPEIYAQENNLLKIHKQRLSLIDTLSTAAINKASSKIQKINKRTDSALAIIQNISDSYIDEIDSKVEKYSERISTKTIKTLERLSRWESKIKSKLEKIDKTSHDKLFANEKMSFGYLLILVKKGKDLKNGYRIKYDAYRDKLSTGVNYMKEREILKDNEITKKLTLLKDKIDTMNILVDNSEQIQALIKKRKKELIDQAFTSLGKSRHLEKINKETWYYVESLKNFKTLFQDEGKIESLVKKSLSLLPGFQKYARENSMLAQLFGSGQSGYAEVLEGLQSRAEVQAIIKKSLTSGGVDANNVFSQNMQMAKEKLNDLKRNLSNKVMGSGEGKLPDFKPNMEKTKTFRQRLVIGTDVQFAKSNLLLPTTMDFAFTAGFKLNGNSIIGLGAGYKVGVGSIDNIRISSQGLGVRSFFELKLKKNLAISSGYEINFFRRNENDSGFNSDKSFEPVQPAALAGLTKAFKIRNKWFKESKISLLYNFLAFKTNPRSQQLLFRVGYNFN